MNTERQVRFAVVGLGHIAQVAVLPGFAQVPQARLVALFSGDAMKRHHLGRKYAAAQVHDYDAYDRVLESGDIDAVYIALPNHLHRDYAVRAAQRGVHVLVEKPMAVDEEECVEMIDAAEVAKVKLMVAYRLHFDPANLEAVELVQNGRLGTPRIITSTFTQSVVEGNVRLMPVAKGGGPVYDMGIYCINAARYLFRDEPTQVQAVAASRDDPRFRDSPEMVTVTLHFPGEKIANFTCSFGAADSSRYEVLGDAGRLVMEPAYGYTVGLRYTLETLGSERKQTQGFGKHDQFGAELQYFCECVLEDRAVEPDGLEGLADVHIVRAVHRAAEEHRTVPVVPVRQRQRPDLEQAYRLPGVRKPKTVNAEGPSGD
jgi:glucose-fructose oxidoreductase